MKSNGLGACIGVSVLGVLAGAAMGAPDVIVGTLTGVNQGGGVGPRFYGTVGTMAGFSIGTTSCNNGDSNLNWIAGNNNHPVIAQNIYKILDGRITQIGQSWLKHGFCALQNNDCGFGCMPAGGGCYTALGPGCSDPYSSSLNGDQTGLGPRSEVNPSTGVFPYPFTTQGQTGNSTFKRIQVQNSELDPALNPGAIYLSEGQYVAKDDAAAGNGYNNASYRLTTVGTATGTGSWYLNFAGNTQRMKPAIVGWAEVGLFGGPDFNVFVDYVDVPGDGRIYVASRVQLDNDGETYHYSYAVQNINSDRAVGGVSLVGQLVDGSDFNIWFTDIDPHSGEPWDPTDWNSPSGVGSPLRWASTQTFAENPNANACRWGTLYAFGFDSTRPPQLGDIELELFKTGSPASMTVSGMRIPTPGPTCDADFDGDGDADGIDVGLFLQAYGTGSLAADLDGDGDTDGIDVGLFLQAYGLGC